MGRRGIDVDDEHVGPPMGTAITDFAWRPKSSPTSAKLIVAL
jgi:hypothetical protein